MAKTEVTNDEIMTAVSRFADHVDTRFDRVEERLDKVEADVAELKSDVAKLNSRVDNIYSILDTHMARIETLIQETKVQAHQQAPLERWIFQLCRPSWHQTSLRQLTYLI